MPQSTLPKSFVPDTPVKLPKSFVPDTPTSRSTFTPPPDLDRIRMDQAAKYPSQQEKDAASGGNDAMSVIKRGMGYKIAKAGLTAIPEAIGIDLESPVTGTVKNIIGGGQQLAQSFLSDPALVKRGMPKPDTGPDNWTQKQDVAAGVVHGPSEIIQGIMSGDPERIAGGFGNIIGMVIGGKVGQRATDAIPSSFGLGSRPNPVTDLPESTISALSTMAESGVKNDLVNSAAEQAIQTIRESAAELGVTASEFPMRSMEPAKLRAPGARAVRTAGEKAIKTLDHAVDIADRPFKDVLKQHGPASIERAGMPPHMTTKGRVLSNLDQAISENSNNPALMHALQNLRGRVESAKTFNDLQSLKALANKKANALFDKSLGQQINASADASYSWKVLGDSIRAEMYPDLASLSGVDLSTAGRLEGVVMDVRDGVRKHYYKDVLNPHNKRMQQTYWEYVRDGSLSKRNLFARMMMLEPTPAGMFNKRFAQVLDKPLPMPSSVPVYPQGAPSTLAPPTLAGVQRPFNAVAAESIPSGGPGPLLAPPQVNPAQDYLAQQHQRNIWTQATPPPAETGQLSLMRGMTPEAAPRSTMGMGQTPAPATRFNPMERATYTMMDLRQMAQEIADFVQANPNHPEVQTLRADLKSVSDEIHARNEAQRVASVASEPPVTTAPTSKPPVSKPPAAPGPSKTPLKMEPTPVTPTPVTPTFARFNLNKPAKYTTHDLRLMAQQLDDFVQANPNYPEVQALTKDLKTVEFALWQRLISPERISALKGYTGGGYRLNAIKKQSRSLAGEPEPLPSASVADVLSAGERKDLGIGPDILEEAAQRTADMVALDDARNIMNMIAESRPSSTPLYRGISLDPTEPLYKQLVSGGDVNLGISSFSSDPMKAKGFTGGSSSKQHRIIVELEPGAKALGIPHEAVQGFFPGIKALASEGELLTSGKYKITGTEYAPARFDPTVKQLVRVRLKQIK